LLRALRTTYVAALFTHVISLLVSDSRSTLTDDDDEACIALYKLYLYLHCKAIVGVCELSGGGRAYVVPHSTTTATATTAVGDSSATRRPAERVLVFHVSGPDS
jgi:hypothetical protein